MELPDGTIAIVDAADLPLVSRYRWRRNKAGYVVRSRNGRLHTMLVSPKPGFVTDHADGDPLNNRRANLRHATPSQSNANRSMPLPASGYRGVRETRSGRWEARIRVNKRLLRLGVYNDALHAALAYNVNAIRYFGQFARLNPITITFEIRLKIA